MHATGSVSVQYGDAAIWRRNPADFLLSVVCVLIGKPLSFRMLCFMPNAFRFLGFRFVLFLNCMLVVKLDIKA